MSYTLILNSSNVVAGTNNNTYRYNFRNGSFNIPPNSEICVGSCQIPYSFFNITSVYNNNFFSLNFPIVGAGTNNYVINISDGFYSTTDLNNFLQQFCITNSLYLINASGQNVYYAVLTYNPTYYSNQILCFPLPTSLPVGWSAPVGWNGYPSTTRTPQIIISASNNFGSILGFSSGSYPPISQITTYSVNSNITPIGSTVNSILIRCSIVSNSVGNPSDILDSFVVGQTTFGSNIDYVPSFEKLVKANTGAYNNFILQFVDQDLNPIIMNDPNISITLLLKI